LNEIKAQDVELIPSERKIKESYILESEQDEVVTNKKFESLLKSITSVNNNIMNYSYSYSKVFPFLQAHRNLILLSFSRLPSKR
jgi:hypothetical protein